MKADAFVLTAVTQRNAPLQSLSGGARYASQQRYKTWTLLQKNARTCTRNSPAAYLAALQAARLATRMLLVSPLVHAKQL